MSLVRRAVRGEANSFGRNSMLTNRGYCGKTQGQSCFERLRGEFGLINHTIRNWRLFFHRALFLSPNWSNESVRRGPTLLHHGRHPTFCLRHETVCEGPCRDNGKQRA
jgi:hypothetical protein